MPFFSSILPKALPGVANFSSSSHGRQRATKPRLHAVESLEQRLALTVYVVDSLVDDNSGTPDGTLTLREAVMAADANTAFGDAPAGEADGDLITFDSSLAGGTMLMTNGELVISDQLIIDGGELDITLDGNGSSRVFNINSAVDIAIAQLTATNGASDSMGGAINIEGGGNVTLDRLTISHSVANGDGGGAIANDGNTLMVLSSTIQSNTAAGASGSGGGILSSRGVVEIRESTISSNQANRAGGGIEIVDGDLTIRDADIDGNLAGTAGAENPGNGGGLHISGSNGTRVRIIDGLVRNNSAAAEGGGIWNQTGSTLIVRDGAVVTNNVASGDAADQGGGGIFSNGGTLRIADATISSNTADGALGSGGGILSASSQLLTRLARIRGNQANRAGGGIEIIDGYAVLIDTDLGGFRTFHGNTAGPAGSATPGNGGGLHVSGNSANVQFLGGSVEHNQASAEGGGLWHQSGSFMVVRDTFVARNTASGDAPDQGGGGIFNNGGRMNLADAIIFENVANGDSGSGGGILSTTSELFIRGGTIAANVANRAGGGIEVIDGHVTLIDVELGGAHVSDGNVAGPTGSASPGNGGGLHVSGANGTDVKVMRGLVGNNRAAREGGGLWNQAGSKLVISDAAVIADNVASGPAADDGGGGIFNNGGTLIVTGGSLISGNVADGALGGGGGIFSSAGAVTIKDSQISANKADRAGGGIEVVDGAVTLRNVDLGGLNPEDGNVAGTGASADLGNGGGLHIAGMNGTQVVVLGGHVRNNKAASEGGGLWGQSGSRLIVRDGVRVSSNEATGDRVDNGGGGIFNNGGELRVLESVVEANGATGAAGSGGGIFSTSGVVMVRGTTISANEAVRAGGGIEVVDGLLTLTGSTLGGPDPTDGNTAGSPAMANPGNGGGLHVSNVANVELDSTTIQHNKASNEGGGLWNQVGSLIRVRNSTTVANNAADGEGGGGIFNRGTMRITRLLIANNTTMGTGGGIMTAAGSNLTLIRSTVTENSAFGDGGGLFNGGSTFSLAVSFTFNDTRGTGGAIRNDVGSSITMSGTNFFRNSPNNDK